MSAGTESRGASTADPLGRCLEPVGPDEFFERYWENEPLHVPRREYGRFDDLLSVQSVEHLVCSTNLRFPAFRLVKAGEQLNVADYTFDRPYNPVSFTAAADVPRVVAEFERGATILLSGLHIYWQPLVTFCRELERALGHGVGANAYFTPRHSQGFSVHHDTHDVLILQLAGSKRWLVYPPVLQLPVQGQDYSEELGAPGEPAADLVLNAGDTLYLPRGWLHQATTSDVDSLHLTLGIQVYTWLDALRAAVNSLVDDIDLRRAVRRGAPVAGGLLSRLAEELDATRVDERMRAALVAGSPPVLDGQITQLRALDDLSLETVLERRDTALGVLRDDGDEVVLALGSREVRLSSDVAAALRHCLDASASFRPVDLPGELDAGARLRLVWILVREGVVRIKHP